MKLYWLKVMYRSCIWRVVAASICVILGVLLLLLVLVVALGLASSDGDGDSCDICDNAGVDAAVVVAVAEVGSLGWNCFCLKLVSEAQTTL